MITCNQHKEDENFTIGRTQGYPAKYNELPRLCEISEHTLRVARHTTLCTSAAEKDDAAKTVPCRYLHQKPLR